MSHTPYKIAKRLIAVSMIGFSSVSSAQEVQNHGLWFEHWLCDTFFDGYRSTEYTQKWDIPAEANKHHGGLPVNPKATKLGSPIGFGDALRQFELTGGTESFILIVGFWEQTTPTTKRWVNTQAVTVTSEKWRKLWHPITRADLEKLDAVIKDTTRSLEETRRLAQQIKSKPPFTEAIIVVNPKINSTQRRLQCSLGFNAFFDHLLTGKERTAQQNPTIWGKPIPKMPDSAPRTFKD